MAERRRPGRPDRRKAMPADRESLHRLLANLPDGVLLLDQEGRVRFANPAAEALFGYGPATMLGNLLGFPVIAGVTEIEIPSSDGSLRTAEIHAVRIQWQGEELVLADLRDVSALKDTQGKLLSLGRHLVEAYEYIHNRVGKELHDTVGQPLIGLKLALHRFRALQDQDPDVGLGEIGELVDEMIDSIRELSHSLRPPVGDGFTLKEALENHFHRLEYREGFRVHLLGTFPQAELTRIIQIVVFRIVEEGLDNVMRYAGVEEAEVVISTEEGRLVVRIDDRGRGFDTQKAVNSVGVGLKAMRERAELAGGSLSVDSAVGRGTRLTAVLPLS
jgi:signal transduction histidine kinase